MQLRKYQPDFVLYRDKTSKEYEFHAQNFVQMCKMIPKLKFFLHQNYQLAKELGATGVHLTSQQFDAIELAKTLGLEVVISTHTKDEVVLAQSRGADYVTYSPIFETPDKGKPKGVEDLRDVVQSVDIKVFALGGIISQEQVDALGGAQPFGFASIRYFTS